MPNPHRRFVRTLLTACVVCLLAVGGFNLLVDPFDLFRLVAIPGFNEKKPEFFNHLRMAKAHAVRMIRPKGIILGTSRAEYGLDPDHPGWRPDAWPRYNLALSSASIYECLAYLRHAHALGGVRQVVLGLDLFMFFDEVRNQADFSEGRLAPDKPLGLPLGWFKDLLVSLLSVDALQKSISTIRAQVRDDLVLYLGNGLRDPQVAWLRIQRRGGHGTIEAKLRSDGRPPGKAPGEEGYATRQGKVTVTTRSMNDFRELLRFCRQNGIDLRLFISPTHAIAQVNSWRSGEWPIVETWKREVLHSLNLPESTDARGNAYPLWDFTGFNGVTTEDFPAPGDDKTQMRWYWESSHYKKETGDLVLDRLFGCEGSSPAAPARFGALLTPSSVESQLARIRAERDAFLGRQEGEGRRVGANASRSSRRPGLRFGDKTSMQR